MIIGLFKNNEDNYLKKAFERKNKKPGLEFNLGWAPVGLRTTEWVPSHLQTLMLDVGCCLSLNSISHIFDRLIHKQEVNFFVRQCWKSKRLTAKMQVTFTSTYTNGKRTLILPLRILQITVCITCRLQSEKIYIFLNSVDVISHEGQLTSFRRLCFQNQHS